VKFFGIVFLKRKTIALGEQSVSEYTLLEYKKWFSLKLFNFHKTSGLQDRFHTHAFGAVSIRLFGNYVEELLIDNKIVQRHRNHKRFLFIPMDTYHRITRSEGCWTVLITGPWGENFKELRDCGDLLFQEVTCGPGRVDVSYGPVIQLTEK
jgi:hypothetical protein